jgi:hypothetical protein
MNFKNLKPKVYERILNPTEADIQKAKGNFPFFCGSFLMIKPKQDIIVGGKSVGPLIPFNFNPPQQAVWNLMVEMINEGKGIKLVILKARQFGISTFFCAFLFWLMWRLTYVKTGIASHKKGTYQELVETCNTFYQNMPLSIQPKLRANKRGARVSKDDMQFDDRNSVLSCSVAQEDAFRGQVLNAALCTEVSSYKDADLFFEGFLSAMTKGALSALILESSPKDGWFRTKYRDAEDGKAGFRAIFLPWWMHPALYSEEIKYGNSSNKKNGIYTLKGEKVHFDQEEKDEWKILNRLAKQSGHAEITAGQMYWRQQQIELFDMDIEKFNQEYPRDATTCFLRSTHSAFKNCLAMAQDTVDLMEEECPNNDIGNLVSNNYHDSMNPNMRIEFLPELRPGYTNFSNRYGAMFFEFPKKDHTYCIGVDVAAEHLDDGSTDNAFSVISVYCCNCKNQAAEWVGKIEPHFLGDEAAKMGYFYNEAMINVEVNNMGYATQSRLMLDLCYPYLFKWPHFDQPDKLTTKTGWYTNSQTKPLLISNFKVAVMEQLYLVRSPHLLEEMEHYVIKNGEFQKTDLPSDRIMAAALSWASVRQSYDGYEAEIVMASRADTKAIIHSPKKMAPKVDEDSGSRIMIGARGMHDIEDEDLSSSFIQDIFDAVFDW